MQPGTSVLEKTIWGSAPKYRGIWVARAEDGTIECRLGWDMGGICTPIQPTRGLREVASWAPNWVRGGAPVGNAFWHILKATECLFSHLYAYALSSSNNVLCHICVVRPKLRGRGQLPACINLEPRLHAAIPWAFEERVTQLFGRVSCPESGNSAAAHLFPRGIIMAPLASTVTQQLCFACQFFLSKSVHVWPTQGKK